jgi:DNA-binding XRE family transcriptional regulator
MTAIPKIRKKYFEHGLGRTAANKARLHKLAKSMIKIRADMGLTVAELARRVGCSWICIYHIEKEQNYPSWEIYLGICEALKQSTPPLS